MPERSSTFSRHNCPCCGYPTLTERASYEICELCNWEDDGQDDDSADEVWGGPNSDYSLTEARENFKKYRVMYSPQRDQRLTGGDSPHEFKTKGELMAALQKLAQSRSDQVPQLLAEIARLEAALQAETERQVAAYEAAQRGDA
jgi:hypothetical protein